VLAAGARARAEELIEHLRPRVARFWLPDEFAFLDALPRTSVGKFDKKQLRAELAEGAFAQRVRVGES